MQLHDTTIAQIVKLIQMALLTGTDVIKLSAIFVMSVGFVGVMLYAGIAALFL